MIRICGESFGMELYWLFEEGSARFLEARNIARNQVDFEVDAITDLALVPRGHLQRVRDQQALETIALDLVDGERGAGERYRAFGGDETGELRRCLEGEARRFAEVVAADDGCDPVDVSGDEVA